MFRIRKPSKYGGYTFKKDCNWDVCLHISQWAEWCMPRYSGLWKPQCFPKHGCLSLLPPLYQKNVYLNIVPSPQALLLFTDLKKWHHYFTSEFFKATIVQLNYWIHLYLIVLLVLMCYWTAFLSEAVSFPHGESKAISRKYITWARQSLISVIYSMLKPH